MRRTINRILAIMTTALLAFVTSGCVEPLDNNVPGIDPDAVYLPIRLYIPGAIPATKVSPSDINGLTGNAESQIHCVQVWMFSHMDPALLTPAEGETEQQTQAREAALAAALSEHALAYAEAGTLTGQKENLPNGSGYYAEGYWENKYTYKLSMRIPKRILKGDNLKFDFYVLANAKSIGTTTLQAMTRGELKESMFGGGASDDFGTTSPVTKVGTDGLPISGFFNKGSNSETAANASGVDLSFLKEDKVFTPADFYENLPIVQLERAVSRIRFSFARPTGMTRVQIVRVEIERDLIPTSTYVFPRENGQFPTDYVYPTSLEDNKYVTILQGTTLTTPLLSDTQIKEYENPEELKSTSQKVFNEENIPDDKSYKGKAPTGMTANDYNDLLDDYTTSKYVYLRESGKPIKGQITYSLDGGTTTKTADFFMMPPTGSNPENPYDYPNTTNFYRNHSWTVYGYFKGDGLYIVPKVLPWWNGGLSVNTQQGSAVVAFSTKKETIFAYGWTTANDNPWWKGYTSVSPQFFASNDEEELPENPTWKNTPFVAGDYSDNTYFWIRSKILYQGNTTYSSPVKAANVSETTTITKMEIEYASGDNASTAPTDGWSSEVSAFQDKPFIWSRVVTTYSDNTTQTSAATYLSRMIPTEWYFRRQDEGYTSESDWNNDWFHSQVIVAPGHNQVAQEGITGGNLGTPVFANRIELRTSGYNVPLRLKLSNPNDFYIVTYYTITDSTNPAYSTYYSWTGKDSNNNDIGPDAEIPLIIAQGGTSYFYVVPKEGNDHVNKKTAIYLVTNDGSDKIPFNASVFPGSNENTEIFFYSVSQETFKGYYTELPTDNSVKVYGKSGEIEI